MSFWDQVRRLFGGNDSTAQNAVRDAMLSRVARRESFTALDIANEVTANDPHRTADDVRKAADVVHRLAQDGLLVPLGYKADANGRFGPLTSPPVQPPPPNVVGQVGSTATQHQQQQAPPPVQNTAGLSHEQRLRSSIDARAKKREPFSTMDLVFEITKTGAPDFMQVATLAGNLAKDLLPPLGFSLEGGMWRYGSTPFNPSAPANESKIRASLQARAGRRETFAAAAVAAELVRTDNPQFQSVLSEVVRLAAQVMPGLGYSLSGGMWRPAGSTSTTTHTASNVTPIQPVRPAPPKPADDRTYATNPEILGLSADELRKRAVKMNPFSTPWIGRVDTIPPQSDERTALIDRGLILRGLLNESQLAEIHRVGDLWLRFHEADRLADAMARRSADEAVARLREEKAAKKAARKKAAEEKEKARVAAVAKRKAEDVIFLGRGVSKGLADRRGNPEALQQLGVPVWTSPAEVAQGLGLSIKQLRWLAFHAEASRTSHYHFFEIPRRSGGTRLLSAPHELLKTTQRKILELVLSKVPHEPEAHGFIKGRNVVSNAKPHLGQGVVLNVDLKDFFPTVTFRRVRGLFESFGYSPAAATVLGLLCTEAPRRKVTFTASGSTKAEQWWVATGERRLPQGAPTSPAIANAVSRRLDRRLRGRLAKRGWVYTRYADDLSFSRKDFTRAELGFVHASIRHVVEDEGFALNPKKGRAQGKGGRQEVTGVVVNVKPNVSREQLRKLRAELHQAKKKGLTPERRRELEGTIAYVSMVNREKGDRLKAALASVTG